jgi:hypothetical protein
MYNHGHDDRHTILYICVLELIYHMLQILYIIFIDEPLLGLGTGSIVGLAVGLLCAIVIIVKPSTTDVSLNMNQGDVYNIM